VDVSVSAQAYMFLVMVVCGVFCGLIFDLFRSVRRAHRCHSGVVAVQDIVFWLAELALVYTVAFKLNYAKVMAYELVALVIGSWIYFMTVTIYVVRILSGVIVVSINTGRIVFKPFVKLAKVLTGFVLWLKSAIFLQINRILTYSKDIFGKLKAKYIKKDKKTV